MLLEKRENCYFGCRKCIFIIQETETKSPEAFGGRVGGGYWSLKTW